MHPIDFLALLEAAGLPPGLPLRLTDAWVAHRLGVDKRTTMAPPLAMCYEPPAFRFKDLPP